MAEGVACLGEELAAMGEEQQARPEAGLADASHVVERGDHGLPHAGRRDDEVAVATVNLALGAQAVEDLLLKLIGPEREEGHLNRPGSRLGLRAA
jgi:hypothetical protein